MHGLQSCTATVRSQNLASDHHRNRWSDVDIADVDNALSLGCTIALAKNFNQYRLGLLDISNGKMHNGHAARIRCPWCFGNLEIGMVIIQPTLGTMRPIYQQSGKTSGSKAGCGIQYPSSPGSRETSIGPFPETTAAMSLSGYQ